MNIKLADIADLIDREVAGDEDKACAIKGFSGVKESLEGDFTFITDQKYAFLAEKSKASAFLVSEGIAFQTDKPIIYTSDASADFTKIVSHYLKLNPLQEAGIHPTAIVPENFVLEKGVSIGPYAVIQDGVTVAENTVIGAYTFIGYHAKVGSECLIYAQVVIGERCLVGDRVILHSGVVVGADGFGFNNQAGSHHKIPQLGIVRIESDVEMGANSCVDRARFKETVIGAGTKIDNQVQIGHNAIIGKRCLILAQSGVAGSTTIGDDVVIAAKSGISGHLKVASGSVVAACSGVIKDIDQKMQVMGYPARPHLEFKRTHKLLQKLSDIFKRVSFLEKKFENLENDRDETKNN